MKIEKNAYLIIQCKICADFQWKHRFQAAKNGQVNDTRNNIWSSQLVEICTIILYWYTFNTRGGEGLYFSRVGYFELNIALRPQRL